MFILVSLVLLWLLVGVWKTSSSQWYVMPFSTNATLPLRGILALMIVFHHFPVFFPRDYAYINVADGWGGAICSLFFLFSGYGVTKSYVAKGDAYIKGFLSKRLPKIVIPASIVLGGHILVRFMIGGGDLGLLVSDISNILSVLSHYWFIYTLFIFYFVFYLSFRFFRNAVYGTLVVCVAAIIYYYVTKEVLRYSENWWNSIHGIAIGSIIANMEPKVKPWLENNKTMYRHFVSVIILIVCTYNIIGCYLFFLPAWGTVFFFLLPFFVYVCNSFIQIPTSAVFCWMGKISLEIYLVHVSVMLCCRYYISNIHLCLVMTFILTLILATFLNKIAYAIDKYYHQKTW